jgi:hypothetical protein
MNLTPLQIIGIILAVNGALTGATAQLTDLFGAIVAKDIVSVASLGSAILGGIITSMSGQSSQIRNVAAITGDDGKPAVRINVNANAGATLAAAAIDPSQKNIGAASPDVQAVLTKTANAA